MVSRRLFLGFGGALGGSLALGRIARAQDWRGAYPELVYAVVPAENATGVSNRFGPFVAYMSLLGREVHA